MWEFPAARKCTLHKIHYYDLSGKGGMHEFSEIMVGIINALLRLNQSVKNTKGYYIIISIYHYNRGKCEI